MKVTVLTFALIAAAVLFALTEKETPESDRVKYDRCMSAYAGSDTQKLCSKLLKQEKI